MSVMIKWRQPKAAAKWELKRSWRVLRGFRWHYIAMWLILGGSKLYQVRQLHPDQVSKTAVILTATALLLPAVGYLYLYVYIRLIGVGYDMSDRGLRRRSDRSVLHRWGSVEAFQFSDYPGAPRLRALEFKVQRSDKWRRWAFDPSEVKESVMRTIMEHRLPGKGLDVKKPASPPKRKPRR